MLEQDHSCCKKRITRWCPIMQICTPDALEMLLSVLLLIVLKFTVFIKFYRCHFMCALWQGCTSACVPFEWPGVPGRFLSGYSESPDGLMCLISRSHKPLWTHSTDPWRLVPGESGNSQCSLRGAKWYLYLLKVKIHCYIMMFHNVCLTYFDMKVVWDYNSRSGGQYQPSDVAQF